MELLELSNRTQPKWEIYYEKSKYFLIIKDKVKKSSLDISDLIPFSFSIPPFFRMRLSYQYGSYIGIVGSYTNFKAFNDETAYEFIERITLKIEGDHNEVL